jgi:AraC-like DNA-binding protein
MTLQSTAVPRIEYLHSAHLPEVGFLVSDHDTTAWHVFNERYVLCGADRATASVRYRGKTEPLFNGANLLLEPGEAHRNIDVHQPQNFRVVFVETALFERTAKAQGLRKTPHFRGFVIPHPQLIRAIYRLCDSVEANEMALEQQSRLLQCVRLAFAHTEETQQETKSGYNHDAIRRAQAYLHEHFNEAVSLDELSAIAGLSPYHLVRSFTRRFGLPPHAYQIHVRVERARALLTTGMPPVQVASSVGFADQSHFTRHFRRINNVTPANYARAFR